MRKVSSSNITTKRESPWTGKNKVGQPRLDLEPVQELYLKSLR